MDRKYDKTDSASILLYARQLLNKSLRRHLPGDVIMDIEKKIDKNKGSLGNLLEEYYFGYKPNNRPEPDFPEAKLELKTAGIINRSGRYVPKEPRLTLSMINYHGLCEEQWESSSLLQKNSLLLLMFYLHKKEKLPIDYIFKIIDIWHFPTNDLLVIKQDWERIANKVRDGKAHELSEGDTFYLGAATKGATAKKSLVSQPFSSVKARSRAFSLKKTYLEVIIANLLARRTSDWESAIREEEQLMEKSFEEIVVEKFEPYIGLTVEEIAKKVGFDISSKPKHWKERLARAIVGVRTKKIEEFEKAGIVMKTIPLTHTGYPKEAMSFRHFEYLELVKETWEGSQLKDLLSKKFFWVIFKFDDSSKIVQRLEKVMFWNMPYSDLEGIVKKEWKETAKRVKNAQADNLPKASETKVCHVRPHGRDSHDTIPTPQNGMLVKQSFWLNSRYIYKQINKI